MECEQLVVHYNRHVLGGRGQYLYNLSYTKLSRYVCIQGLQEKLCKAKKTALGPRGLVEISLKIEDLRSTIKLLVNCHKCFISCSAECPNSIYFIQSSGKHNQLHVIQQDVFCLSCFIVNKIWSIAIKTFWNPKNSWIYPPKKIKKSI